jgi:C1A family cysteine protease
MTPKLGKGLGRKPDEPDPRDLHLPPMAHLGVGAPLPSSVDVFAGLTLPVYDQGTLGSCTANAGVLYRRFLAQRFSQYSAPDIDLSRLFLYYQERKLEGTVHEDSGAQIRDTFKTMAKIGVCAESLDAYVASGFADESRNDTHVEIENAALYRIGAYHRVSDVDRARSCLASGYAIELGFTVYESFESIDSSGVMPMPRASEGVLGGHAVVIRGYDDELTRNGLRGYFAVQNSWGPEWGARGGFLMPYAFIENAELSGFDMWMGHLGRPWRAN